MDLKLLIVNYHYIREVLPPRGIYNITPDAFEKQLEAIHHNGFHFISLEDIQIAVREKSAQSLNKKSCLVTFDDGLRESYELGLSILDRKGIPGAFYISSSTIGHGKVLDVHTIIFKVQ
jgi:peptidoglycan/xylan/chitin deacetylase (PgdA/CDA1 family)